MDTLAGAVQPDNTQVDDPPSKPRSVALGLTRTYAAGWRVKDALRELYQNWKDAILQTHEMPLEEFTPVLEYTPDEITIVVKGNVPLLVEAGGPTAQLILGYIRFNKIHGSAEFTNFGASLNDQCLEMGTTTKSNDDRLIGGHGEGLKIAALVLCREHHHVKISASGCYWNFGFNGLRSANFYCRLTPTKAKRIPAGPPGMGSIPRLTARIREDVSVLIEKGHTEEGRRLQMADFGAWMRETLDLHMPAGRVRTPSGDLLLGRVYKGHLYLKGIRLPQESQGGAGFYFGYNILRGNVDRDRHRLMDSQSVAEAIHSIWGHAIAREESVSLPRYIELLCHHSTSADANGADRLVTEATAIRIWAMLSRQARVDGVFYYQEARRIEYESMIRSELKKQPRPLPEMLWKICRQHGLIREPIEELEHQFQNSQEVELPDTIFAHGLANTLRALLMLNSRTATMRVVFVHCDVHAVDLAYSAEKDVLYVHAKWLRFPPASSLEEPEAHTHMGWDAFVCQHVVGELYRRTLGIVFSQADGMRLTHDLGLLLETTHQKLRQMPRMIEASLVEEDTALKISFYTGHSHAFVELYGSQVNYLVVLHKAGCSDIVTDFVYCKDRDICDCPRATVSLSLRTVIFRNLDRGLWIPMVAKQGSQRPEDPCTMTAQEGTLIGVSPQVISLSHGDSASPLLGNYPISAVPPTVSFSGDSLESGVDELVAVPETVSATNMDHGFQAEEDGLHTPQIDGNQPSVKTAETSELSTLMEAGDVKGAPVGPEISAPFAGTASALHHSATTTPGRTAGSSQPSPLTVSIPCGTEQGGIADTGLEPGPRDEPTAGMNTHNDSSPLHQSTFVQQMTSEGTPWWKIWANRVEKNPPGSSWDREESVMSDETWELCDDYEQFASGTCIQVTIAPGSGWKSVDRQVLFIHKILKPVGRSRFAHSLVVTRYSFLVDYLGLKETDTSISRELLLHFRDPDHMAEEKDADIIAVGDITLVDAGPSLVTVSLINSAREPTTGFFARFGVWEKATDESLFVTPLGPYLFKEGRPAAPRFSPLPAASIFDFSPRDIGLSTSFAQAGYRICAAIGFDDGCHKPWKIRHPGAALYEGDAASVVADLDSGKATLSLPGELEAPRIAVVSGGSLALAVESKTDGQETVADKPEAFALCDIVAQSPVLSPDFIVLTLFVHSSNRRRPASWLTSPVVDTIRSLLVRGYSISFRSLPYPDPQQTELVLLAAPGGTNPQWIDDTLSDIQGSSVSTDFRGHPSCAPHAQTSVGQGAMEMATQSSMNSTDPKPVGEAEPDLQPTFKHFPTTAHYIASIISRIIGEFSKHAQGLSSASGPVEVERAQHRDKRQKV